MVIALQKGSIAQRRMFVNVQLGGFLSWFITSVEEQGHVSARVLLVGWLCAPNEGEY